MVAFWNKNLKYLKGSLLTELLSNSSIIKLLINHPWNETLKRAQNVSF